MTEESQPGRVVDPQLSSTAQALEASAPSASPIVRQPFQAADLEPLLSFVAAHPCAAFGRPLLRRFMTELVSGPEGVIDLWTAGERALLAVVIDTCENASDAANLELLALRRDALDAAEVERLAERMLQLAEDFARRGPRTRLEVGIVDAELMEDGVEPTGAQSQGAHSPGTHRAGAEPPGVQPQPVLSPGDASPALLSAARLERRRYHEAYRTWLMRRPEGPLAAPATTLPPAMRWIDVTEAHLGSLHALTRAAFAGQPGANIASLEEWRQSFHHDTTRSRLLLDGDRPVGFATFAPCEGPPGDGEVRTLGLDPAYRGRGLGDHLLFEAMRQLEADGVTRYRLDVVATNTRALRLYLRAGFRAAEGSRVFQLELRDQPPL